MKCKGFSIVEMILVSTIIGMMSAIAVPRYSQFVVNQQIEAAARRVTADLALAQREARLTSSSRTVSFKLGENTYSLTGINDLDRVTQPYEVNLNEEPYRATIVSANFGGNSEIIFNGFGAPDSGGSVVIGVGAWRKTITVDPATGRTKPGGAMSEVSIY